jgi:hypothetical protein
MIAPVDQLALRLCRQLEEFRVAGGNRREIEATGLRDRPAAAADAIALTGLFFMVIRPVSIRPRSIDESWTNPHQGGRFGKQRQPGRVAGPCLGILSGEM